MHSLAKLSLLAYYLITFENYVSGQTTVSSLYIPSISDSGGLDDGSFVVGSLVGAQDGTSTYLLVLGSNTDTETDTGPTPIFTLVEASTTAHLFVEEDFDDGESDILDIQCTINGGLSTCEEVAGTLSAGVAVSATTFAFTETVSPIPVTFVESMPSMTFNSAQPTSGSSSPSSGSSSKPTPSASPSPVTSGNTTSTPSTNPPRNFAVYYTFSALLCAFPLTAVLMLL